MTEKRQCEGCHIDDIECVLCEFPGHRKVWLCTERQNCQEHFCQPKYQEIWSELHQITCSGCGAIYVDDYCPSCFMTEPGEEK